MRHGIEVRVSILVRELLKSGLAFFFARFIETGTSAEKFYNRGLRFFKLTSTSSVYRHFDFQFCRHNYSVVLRHYACINLAMCQA